MIEYFDFDLEFLTTKLLFEFMHSQGFFCPPMVSVFKGGVRLASALCRDIDVANDDDKDNAFKELLSLVPVTQADICFFAFDASMGFDTKSLDAPVDKFTSKIDAFTFLMMTRKDKKVIERNAPYIEDRKRNLWYISHEALNTSDSEMQGLIPDLMKVSFDLDGSSLGSLPHYARTLKSFGHSVATWQSGKMNLYT